jgi:ornithine cyclodeaminase/alanine dehydrogenase-like protein (mu-crystallin family)
MLVLTGAEVRDLLDVDALIDALADGFRALSAGRTSAPPRGAAVVPDAGLLAAMPGYVPGALGAKLVTLFPDADPAHEALIAVFDPDTGSPLAVMDGTEITTVRTAAASALAVRTLAREDARTLAIVGASVQGRAHAEIVPRVRSFERVHLLRRGDDIESAVREADVICLCTDSETPVIDAEWVRPGAHVGSVGHAATGGELPSALLDRARIVVESRVAFEPPLAGAAELQGRDPAAAAELGEVLPARWRDELTVYKSMGHAVEDVVAAKLVHDAAVARGLGTEIRF